MLFLRKKNSENYRFCIIKLQNIFKKNLCLIHNSDSAALHITPYGKVFKNARYKIIDITYIYTHHCYIIAMYQTCIN